MTCEYGDPECEPDGGEPKQMCLDHEKDFADNIVDRINDLD